MTVISGDGVFSHVFIDAIDTPAAVKCYDAVLAMLGISNLGLAGHKVCAYTFV